MRLNPYTQTATWYAVLMAAHCRCWRDECNHRHAVAVEDMKPVCVFHVAGYDGPAIRKTIW